MHSIDLNCDMGESYGAWTTSVIGIDLPLVAQLGANDKIAFHLVNLGEAENLVLGFEKDLNLLKIGIKLTAFEQRI